jgi:hypothetical protein
MVLSSFKYLCTLAIQILNPDSPLKPNKENITQELLTRLKKWRHAGF